MRAREKVEGQRLLCHLLQQSWREELLMESSTVSPTDGEWRGMPVQLFTFGQQRGTEVNDTRQDGEESQTRSWSQGKSRPWSRGLLFSKAYASQGRNGYQLCPSLT